MGFGLVLKLCATVALLVVKRFRAFCLDVVRTAEIVVVLTSRDSCEVQPLEALYNAKVIHVMLQLPPVDPIISSSSTGTSRSVTTKCVLSICCPP